METDPSTEVILRKLDGKVEEYSNMSENCAQNAFLVLQEHLGLNNKAILKALTPFPGGVALRGETCGVVIACLMTLGLVYGRDGLGDLVGYFDTLSPASKFCTRFEKEFGGTTCRDILKSDFRKLHKTVDPEKMSKISATEHRTAVVGKGVKIAVEIIREKMNS